MTAWSHYFYNWRDAKCPGIPFVNLDEHKKNRLIKAAREEFAAHGYQNSSIHSIALKARVAKGSIYQYFEDKKELFVYLFDVTLQEIADCIASALKENKSCPVFLQLENVLLKIVEHARQYPLTYRFYQQGSTALPLGIDKEIRERINGQGAKEYCRQILEQAAARGELRKEINLDLALFIVCFFIKDAGTYILQRDNPLTKTEVEEKVAEFVELVKRGLGK